MMKGISKTILCVVIIFTCLTNTSFAMKQGGNVIIPGIGVGTYQLGGKYPQQMPPQDITLEPTSDSRITKIRIKGTGFVVQYNQLRVGSKTQEIFRFYENLEKSDAGTGRILLRSPRDGIEFIIDRTKDVIEEIVVFEAVIPDSYSQQVRPQKTKKSAEEQKQMKNFYIDSFK